jgi:hypothetical protein
MACTRVVLVVGKETWTKFHHESLKRRIHMLTVEIKENEKMVGSLIAVEKQFKTGSRGYFGMDKILIGEKRYQVQVQLVEIGSKPKPEENALKP